MWVGDKLHRKYVHQSGLAIMEEYPSDDNWMNVQKMENTLEEDK